MKKSRRKTLSHMEIENFLCELGKENNDIAFPVKVAPLKVMDIIVNDVENIDPNNKSEKYDSQKSADYDLPNVNQNRIEFQEDFMPIEILNQDDVVSLDLIPHESIEGSIVDMRHIKEDKKNDIFDDSPEGLIRQLVKVCQFFHRL